MADLFSVMKTVWKNNKKHVIHQISILFIFTILYYLGHKVSQYYDLKDEKGNSIRDKEQTIIDAFHFSLLTQTTVGYGIEIEWTYLTKFINILQLLVVYGIIIMSLFR
jgi:hypothetical protein